MLDISREFYEIQPDLRVHKNTKNRVIKNPADL